MPVSKLRASLALGLLFTLAGAVAAPQMLSKIVGYSAATNSHVAHVKPALARELDALQPGSPYGAFLHFSKSKALAEQDTVIAALGLTIVSDFRRYTDSVYVSGPVSAFRAAMLEPSIYYIEQNRSMRYFNDTETWATKVRIAQEAVAGGPYKDSAGNILMGQGIGIGVVDSGINALNPDLRNRVGKNFKIQCPGFIFVNPPPVPGTENGCVFQDIGNSGTTDQGGGHGTHVSGTLAGDGTSSTASYVAGATPNIPGSFTGVAPRATLHGFSTGEGINVLFATESIRYILDHFNDFTPRIRVTNHSYGVGADAVSGETDPHDPNDTEAQLTRMLVAPPYDVVMVYAAGNDGRGVGDDGSLRETSPGCTNPEPGVICAAGHYDNNTGDPDFLPYNSSSRGLKSDIKSYPDLAAPGQEVTSTCGPGAGAICQSIPPEPTWSGQYGTISGTSMATPNIAGAVALIRQARPALTAPEVERLLKRTARKVSYAGPYIPDTREPAGSTLTTNYTTGAGLLDVQAALDALGVDHPGVPTATIDPPEVTIADGDADNAQAVAGAADVIKLTMQEAARGNSNAGITFRITVRDATAFGAQSSGIGYRVFYNVAGIPYDTAVNYLNATTTPVAAAGKAVPATVSRSGNVLTAFVPIARIGSPAIGTPIHNIRLQVVDLGNPSAPSLDRVPSKSGSTGAQSDIEPAFGMPYTILRPLGIEAAPLESACTAPGVTLLEDPQGDIFALADGTPPNNGTPALDIRKLSVVQPYLAMPPATDYKIELHLKMQSLEVLPTGTWPVSFCSPGFACVNPDTNTQAYGADNKYYTVRMTTDSSVATGATPQTPVFQLLQPTATGTTAASRTIKVITGMGSGYDATGLIRFSLNAADIGLKTGAAGREALSKFQVRVSGPGSPTPDNMPDALTGAGSFTTLPLSQCDPSNVAPVATLTADKTTGGAPLSVTFTLAASDPGDTVDSYALDFGDDRFLIVKSNATLPATVTHQYTAIGNYSARLTVTDSHRKASNIAQQDIAVTARPSNLPPTASLAANPVSGQSPLTVNFSGAGSSDSDGSIAEYRFNFGDGNAEKRQSGATLSHAYTAPGKFRATLTVVDDRGALSAVALSPEITVANTAPVARLSGNPTSGPAPLTVNFSAGSSTDGDSGDAVVSYSFDLDGDGTFETTDSSAPAASTTYSRPGSYTAQLKVKDRSGLESAADRLVITVTSDTMNTAPTASLNADRTNGDAPLTVTFDASGSTDSDSGDRVVSYSFDLDGDGSFEVADSDKPTRTTTYFVAGTYSARVQVKDSKGLESAAATKIVTVTAPRENQPPTARLLADKTEGTTPLEVNFNAGTSSDPDSGDAVVSYSFDLDGDGVYETTGSASATVAKRYETPGTYRAAVKVKDRSGTESAAATVTITVQPPPEGSVATVRSTSAEPETLRATRFALAGLVSFTNRSTQVHTLRSITLTLDRPERVGTLRAVGGGARFDCSPARPAAINICTAANPVAIPAGGTVQLEVQAAPDAGQQSKAGAIGTLQAGIDPGKGSGLWLLGSLGFAPLRRRLRVGAIAALAVGLAACNGSDQVNGVTVTPPATTPPATSSTLVTVKLSGADLRKPDGSAAEYAIPTGGVEVGKVASPNN